jgi:hypothetical protein
VSDTFSLPKVLVFLFSFDTIRAAAARQVDALIIITVNVGTVGEGQRVDLEIVDGSDHGNIYQSKRGLKAETRMAITTHTDADLGICFRNHLMPGEESIMLRGLDYSSLC